MSGRRLGQGWTLRVCLCIHSSGRIRNDLYRWRTSDGAHELIKSEAGVDDLVSGAAEMCGAEQVVTLEVAAAEARFYLSQMERKVISGYERYRAHEDVEILMPVWMALWVSGVGKVVTEGKVTGSPRWRVWLLLNTWLLAAEEVGRSVSDEGNIE